MAAIEQLPEDNTLIRVLSICPLSEPTFAVYSTRPYDAYEKNQLSQPWPVRYEPIAMWALVEAYGKQQITGIHLKDLFQMQYSNQFTRILGYSTSAEPMDEKDFGK